MSKTNQIIQLLKEPYLWQGTNPSVRRSTITTGYIELDRQLHHGGWPQGAISELLIAQHGVGEMRLITPLLRQLSLQQGYIVLVNPPYLPYVSSLQNANIAVEKIILIDNSNTEQSVWAAQQALNSKSCSLVVTWLATHKINQAQRKLALAARQGQCWGIIIANQQLKNQPSAAALRLILSAKRPILANQHQSQHQILHQIEIIKQPGGCSGQTVTLKLFPESQHWTALSAPQWPVPTITSCNGMAPLTDSSTSLLSERQSTNIVATYASTKKSKATQTLIN